LLQLGLSQQRVTETAAAAAAAVAAKVPFLASQQQGCGLHQQLWQQRGMTMMLWRDIVPYNGWYAIIAKSCHVTVCNTDGMAVNIRLPCVTRQQCALAAQMCLLQSFSSKANSQKSIRKLLLTTSKF
jgi:hypothetical protein